MPYIPVAVVEGSSGAPAGTPPTHVGSIGGVESQTGGTLATRPADIATGDTEFVWIETNSGEPGTISTAGWQQLSSSPQSASDTCLAVYWKRYTAGDGFPTVDDTGDHQVSYGIVIRGLSASPIKNQVGTTLAAADPHTIPEVETLDWYSGVLAFVSCGADVNMTMQDPPANSEHWAHTMRSPKMSIGLSVARLSAIGAGGGAGAWFGVKDVPDLTGDFTLDAGSALAAAAIVVAVK